MARHPGRTRGNGVIWPTECNQALGSPVHRPGPLLIPAAETSTNAKGGNCLVVATKTSEGISKVIEPPRVIQVLGGVTREDRDVPLRFVLVLFGGLALLIEADTFELAMNTFLDEGLVCWADVATSGREPEDLLLTVGPVDMLDLEHVDGRRAQGGTDIDFTHINSLVGIQRNCPRRPDLGGGVQCEVARFGKIVPPGQLTYDELVANNVAGDVQRVVGNPGVD